MPACAAALCKLSKTAALSRGSGFDYWCHTCPCASNNSALQGRLPSVRGPHALRCHFVHLLLLTASSVGAEHGHGQLYGRGDPSDHTQLLLHTYTRLHMFLQMVFEPLHLKTRACRQNQLPLVVGGGKLPRWCCCSDFKMQHISSQQPPAGPSSNQGSCSCWPSSGAMAPRSQSHIKH